jgi:hypothetical protein
MAREDSRLDGIQRQHKSTLNHIPLVERKVVDIFGNESVLRNAHSGKHSLLPEARPTFDSCERIDGNQDQNSFHWSRNQAESECLSMVFVPGLNIKGEES